MAEVDQKPIPVVHVDDWVDTPHVGDRGKSYAKFVLLLHRLPAWMKNEFSPWTQQFKLFCTYRGERYRCIGASRLGDVWLTRDFEKEFGYDLRVNVMECLDWSPEP